MASTARLQRTWRRLERYDLEPGEQMALDEALLLDVGATGRPTLSVYTWRPAALSLGFFQRLADVPAAAELPVVRRLTGGKAIHHAAELTFSLAAPLEHPLYAGPLEAGYRRVHGAVARALAEFGLRAELRGGRELASDRPGTGMCFHESSPLDLVWAGPAGWAKGLGSAQRRTRGRVLHHGSIKLGCPAFEEGVATVAQAAGREVAPRELAEALTRCLRAELGLESEADQASPEERRHVAERAGLFGSEGFLARERDALAAARGGPLR